LWVLVLGLGLVMAVECEDGMEMLSVRDCCRHQHHQ
jgi:hypothetical protein